jgi:hypothetical protein
MKNTNHYCLSQSYWSRKHLISEFDNKAVTNQCILIKLLLKSFRVSLKMLEDFVIYCHKYESHLKHQLSEMHFTVVLMWSFIKKISYVKSLINQCFFKVPCWTASEWIKACLCQYFHFLQLSLKQPTLLTTISLKLWVIKIMRHMSLSCFLMKWSFFKHSSCILVNLFFKHRLKIKVFTWL